MNLYCSYEKRTIEEPYDEDGDYSGFNHYYRENHYFYLAESSDYNFLLRSNVDVLNSKYVLAVIYSNGGAFDRTYGYIEVIELSNDLDKLEKIAKSISNGIYLKDPDCKKCNKRQCNEHYKYIPWESYFAYLQDVVIHELEIRKLRKSYYAN